MERSYRNVGFRLRSLDGNYGFRGLITTLGEPMAQLGDVLRSIGYESAVMKTPFLK